MRAARRDENSRSRPSDHSRQKREKRACHFRRPRDRRYHESDDVEGGELQAGLLYPSCRRRHRLLKRTDHQTHCPYKGDASYFSIVVDGHSAENAVWSYEQPFPAMAEIKDHLAFYPNRVDAIEES